MPDLGDTEHPDDAHPQLSRDDLATLLLPDPALMQSPEGDTKGLDELREAAQRRIEEHDAS
jgi:hypothetical protein